jgi:hypothetical protein
VDERPALIVDWKGHEEAKTLPVHPAELGLLGSVLPELVKELQRLAALEKED